MAIQWLFSNNGVTFLDAALSNVGTVITVEFNGGGQFPDPTSDPNQKVKLTLEDRRTGLIEIVNMTSKSGDLLTVERAQESTTALAWPAGTNISCRMTAEVHNDNYTRLTQNEADIVTNANAIADNANDIDTNETNIAGNAAAISDLLQALYPVGSIYMSVSDTSPSSTLGFGTWSAFAEGRALVGVGDSSTTDSQFWGSGDEHGLEKHPLTTAEVAAHAHAAGSIATASSGSHTHNVSYRTRTRDGTTNQVSDLAGSGNNEATTSNGAHTHTITGSTASVGSGDAHNNLQPSIGIYMWRRTA